MITKNTHIENNTLAYVTDTPRNDKLQNTDLSLVGDIPITNSMLVKNSQCILRNSVPVYVYQSLCKRLLGHIARCRKKLLDMGVKQRIIDTPLFLKISCVLIIAAFVINLVAFSAPYWFESDTYHEGLWSICSGTDCTDYTLDNLSSK